MQTPTSYTFSVCFLVCCVCFCTGHIVMGTLNLTQSALSATVLFLNISSIYITAVDTTLKPSKKAKNNILKSLLLLEHLELFYSATQIGGRAVAFDGIAFSINTIIYYLNRAYKFHAFQEILG